MSGRYRDRARPVVLLALRVQDCGAAADELLEASTPLQDLAFVSGVRVVLGGGVSDLGWRADGIERAIACGGIPLETYRRPGFTGGQAVRRADFSGGGFGVDLDSDPWEDDSEDRTRQKRLRRR